MERIIFSECVLGLPVLHVEQPARNYPPCNSSSSCSRQPEKHLPGLTDHAWPDHRHGSPTDLRRSQRQVEIQMGEKAAINPPWNSRRSDFSRHARLVWWPWLAGG